MSYQLVFTKQAQKDELDTGFAHTPHNSLQILGPGAWRTTGLPPIVGSKFQQLHIGLVLQYAGADAAARIPPALLSFMGESRRLSNARAKRELRTRLRYPTVREGIGGTR